MTQENKSMYLCPSCKNSYSGLHEFSNYNCPDCGTPLLEMGLSTEEWNGKTDSQKAEIKDKLLSNRFSDDSYKASMLKYAAKISEDLHFIKTVVLIMVILTIIGVIFMVLQL